MTTNRYFCPNVYCSNFGVQDLGNKIVLSGYAKEQQRLQCQVCGKHFSSRVGTAFWHLKEDEQTVTKVLVYVLLVEFLG